MAPIPQLPHSLVREFPPPRAVRRWASRKGCLMSQFCDIKRCPSDIIWGKSDISIWQLQDFRTGCFPTLPLLP